jgi:enoyl-CoA hydratase
MTEAVVVKTENRVAGITIDRPAALNALNATVLARLLAAVEALGGDRAIGAIVLTGAGERAFVAGADVSELADLSPATAEDVARRTKAVHDAMRRCPKPIVAAINGLCLGGGLELALACDIRIAAANARFGLPEVKLGLIPGGGGIVRLARLAGSAFALELALSGEPVGAERALAAGIVTALHPQADLRAAAGALAAQLAERPAFALAQIKAVAEIAAGADLERAREAEIRSFAQCFATADQKEGVAAFLAKRRPQFSGA